VTRSLLFTIHLNFTHLEKEWGRGELDERYIMASSISRRICLDFFRIQENSRGDNSLL
jgi:hypothetical protein